ncbi:MAG: HNH endonuclease, partial [Bacteroidetes bacterium]
LKQSTLNKTGFEDSKLSEEDWKEALAICNKNINYATVYSDIPKATAGTQTAVNEILAYLLKKLKNAGTSQNASFPITQNLGTSFPTLTKPSTAPSTSNQIVDYAGLSANDKQKLQSYLQNNTNTKVYITSEANNTKSSTEANSTSVYDNVKSQFDTKSALGTSDMAIWMHYNATEKKAYYKIIYKNNYFLPQSVQSLSLEKLLPCVERTQKKIIELKKSPTSTTPWDDLVGGIASIVEVAKEYRSIAINFKIPEKYWKPADAPLNPTACGAGDGALGTAKGFYLLVEALVNGFFEVGASYDETRDVEFSVNPKQFWQHNLEALEAAKISLSEWDSKLEGSEGNRVSGYEGGKLLFAVAEAIIPLSEIGSISKLEKVDDVAQSADEINKYSAKIRKSKLQGAENELTPLLLKSGEEFTILTNVRKLPGTSIGNGKNITGTWLRGTERNAGLFPKSVADKLKEKTFTNFDDFRNQFWKAVADEPSLASQFDANSIQRMQVGLAPFTDVSQQIGGIKNYVLHHKTPINQGGAVYDMDNLYIVTPKYHKEILDPAYHYGYGY